MDYEVNFATLDRAGHKADGLAADIDGTLQDMHMDDVAGAIPGGISGGVATSVSSSWKQTSQQAAQALQHYAKNLSDTARAYRKVEEANEQAANGFFGGN